MKNIKIVLTGVLLAAGMGFSALMNQDFEGQTAGNQPSGTSYLRPTANSTTQAVQVVNSTLLGGNQALQYLDRAVNVGTSSAFSYIFASNGAVVLSFSFSPSYIGGTTANYLSAGLTRQGIISSSTALFGETRLLADGSVRFYSGSSSIYTTNLALNSSNTVSMFVNDTAADMIYSGGTLAANTVDYYLNGSKVYAGASFGTGVSGLGTTNGMGQVTFFDSNARIDLDYLIDNINVEVVPEPATISMLLFGVAGLVAVRRCRK